MKRWSIFSLLLLVCLALLATPVAARDAGTLVVVQEAEPVGLDLMQSSIQTTMSVCYNIHDTLFHPQEDATVLPALAEKWEKVDDLTWKITLRKDAVFHNGEPVNAAAVKICLRPDQQRGTQKPQQGQAVGLHRADRHRRLHLHHQNRTTVCARSLHARGTTCRSYRPSTSRKWVTRSTTPIPSAAVPTG